MGGLQLPAEDRFLNNILVCAGECWPWDGATNRKGYGVIRIDGKTRLAHRFGYEFFGRPLASDEQLHHVCGTRNCVRPDHLEVIEPSAHSRLHNDRIIINQYGTWPVKRSQSNPACSARLGM